MRPYAQTLTCPVDSVHPVEMLSAPASTFVCTAALTVALADKMQVQFTFDGTPFGSALPGRYAETNASGPGPNLRWRPKAQGVLQNSILIQVEVLFVL